jgi:hypothetical protein
MPSHRLVFAALSSLLPSAALASAQPSAVVAAADVDMSRIPGGIINTPGSSATMFDVRSTLGPFAAQNAPNMGLMSTGNVDNITAMQDYDYPGGGADTSAGDHATLQFSLEVPQYANSFSFNFNYLSREYPEWVGSIYNDAFEVWLTSAAYTGQIVFDVSGNLVTVNNALFTVTNPSQLVGTGFDQDGATGWVTTIAPCQGGETLSLSFEIYDVGDGVWDSAVLIDNFQFSENEPPGGGPWTGDDTPENPIDIFFVSPKEGPTAGGTVIQIYGVNFTPDVVVKIGNQQVAASLIGTDTLEVTVPDALAAGAAASGGPVDVTLELGTDTVVLAAGYTYHDEAGGAVPPRITEIFPPAVHPSGGADLQVRGFGFVEGATMTFTDGEGSIDVPVESVSDFGDSGMKVIYASAPEHAVGWVEVVVTNPDTLTSDPPYPFEFSEHAQVAGTGDGGGSRAGCGSSFAPGASALGWMLGLAAVARRRRGGR